ncbi:Vars1, partial [Symbiodinium sp. KB8]
MAAAYNPKAVESAWSAWWEKRHFFTPDPKASQGACESKRFIMVIPPPNVTGKLHLGHTLTGAIEDALTRWHRMCGNVALYVPGVDHAGIATQSVVERRLLKEEKKTRHDLGREEFLKRVWAWKEMNAGHIKKQLQRIASSVDWTRERFTMDDRCARAVEEAFIRFHERGLIYRDNRLVNWCPHLRTALSDLEVDHEDITGKTLVDVPGLKDKVEVGVLCEFKYMVKGTKEALTVATTRLETMLGDTAVAVHPEDDRYKAFHGKELEHPFFPDRKMVVIADTMVDREFGTGCVKITPAHDNNDFKAGVRHKLQQINVFTEDGRINENGGEFKGQHRFEARRTVEEALKKKDLWVGKKGHSMRLGFCSRSKDIIEPYLKPQWWMNCQDLADRSVKALREGELKILPEFHHQTWYHWLENIQEWCISRQLWWGHRIPAYKVVKPAQAEEKWFTGRSAQEAAAKAEKALGTKVEVEQDEDVLDTWFSSGLFPFSVFGWPDTENNEDFKAFFPTSLLETGHDILFFWVARMVMMSLGLTGKLPFHTVYLHAMVRDAHGRKMSKSLGNVIDPLEVIDGISLEDLHQKLYEGNLPDKEIEKAKKGQKEDYPDGIPECGADALRFGLLAYTLQGRNVNLDINRVVGYRHFCNKVWNATRFGLMYFGSDFSFPGSLKPDQSLAWEDRWILSRLSFSAQKANDGMTKYEFANVTTATYSFFLYELCDVYLELLKPRFYGETQDESILKDRQ